MKIYTEQELKSQCTPDIIKKMVELAEGFGLFTNRLLGNIQSPNGALFTLDYNKIKDDPVVFPLLIHRVVEGWNNKQKDETCIIIGENYNVVWWESDLKISKSYDYKDYQPENLTQLECALLHCLIEILKEV